MRRFLVMLAVLIAAMPAWAKPEIKDVQASYGQLGPERKSLECVQGDELYFRFTVTGFTTDKDGNVIGELAFVVADSTGKVLSKQAIPLQEKLALGGGTFPGQVSLTIGEDLAPGNYTVKVTITDNLARALAAFERKFTCKPAEFALVAVRFYQDAEGRVPATVGGVVSQTLFFRARGIGFDKSKGVLDLEMTIQVYDAKGQPVMPKPIRTPLPVEDPKVVREATSITLRGELTLNRTGDFILKISWTDKIAKKTVSFEAPMKVTSP